jgi:hypothetical protein
VDRPFFQSSPTISPVSGVLPADLATVQQKISTLYGTLTPTSTGVLYQEQYDDIESVARYLIALNLPFVIHHPPELRQALRRLGERIIQFATTDP